jgi:hypothetical protein
MTKQQHPITPPPDLVEQWHSNSPLDRGLTVATLAAQWGADQELKACLKAFDAAWDDPDNSTVEKLQRAVRAARRPKPPSLKEQALAELAEWENVMDIASDSPIRRALEQLND